MKVLIIHPQMEVYGGAETVIVNIARYLASKNIETRIITLCTADHPEYQGLDIVIPKETIGYKLRSGKIRDLIDILKMVSKLKQLLKEYITDYDVVNAHNFPATWSLVDSKPVVWQANEFPDLWHNQNPSFLLRMLVSLGRKLDRYIVNKNVDEAVVPDENQARKFKIRYGWLPKVIPYGIEYDIFVQGNKKEVVELYGLDGCFVILHTGMISPSKNQLASIQAVKKLKEYIPNIRLILAGLCSGNNYEQALRQYIHEHGLERYVIFTGHISKNVLANLYHACDIAVYPVKGPGSWLSPFEALCASKPIIVSPDLSAAGIILRKRIGIVTNDLVKGILEIYKNPDNYNEMIDQGKLFVVQNLTWEKYCEKMLTLFYSVYTNQSICHKKVKEITTSFPIEITSPQS